MMSEIPFLFFSLLSFWLLVKINFSMPLPKNWLFVVLIVSTSFTYQIRSTGIALFFGIAMYLLFERKWKYVTAYVVGFLLLALPWYLRNKSMGGNSYVNLLFMKNPYRPELGKMGFFDWFIRFWNNLERYITREIPSGTFNFIDKVDSEAPIVALEWIVGILCISLMIYGLIRIKKYTKLFLFYLTGTFAILLLWPDVWFGIRFLLPLIPLLTFLFVFGLIDLLHRFAEKYLKLKNQPVFYFSMVILSLVGISGYSEPLEKLEVQKRGHFTNNYKNYFELAKWIKNNASDTSVTCCRKPQLFHLYSTKFVTGIKTTLDKEEQIEYLKSKEVCYIVLDRLGYSSTGRNLYPAIKRYPDKFKLVKKIEDPDSRLLQFRPELDYWGEWKNDKRNGKGTYGWEDGTRFEGEWKNNLRNGKGTLVLPNGNQLDGVWTNDTLNGAVFVISKDGDTIEQALFKKNIEIAVIQMNK